MPSGIPVGAATAVFCLGTCFHPHARVERLELVVDGARSQPVTAHSMPRPDVFNELQGPYRSGFWATVPIEARQRPGTVELSLAARLHNGAEESAFLGSFEVIEKRDRPSYAGHVGPGLIAVCMATYEPDMALFRAQIESLRAQTDEHWVCMISDDSSSPERYDAMLELVAGDERFVISRAAERVRFYRNFERALRMAPAQAELIALCDQDDRWYPEKLATLREVIGSRQLAYSDQRLVDARGRVMRETMWRGRKNNYTDLASLLVANTITGASTLFRRELADLALPFPETPGMQFHDHWLALVALASGEIAYVDRPLYDYVQHEGAVFGEVSAREGRSRRVGRFTPRGLFDRLRGGRGAYFVGYLPREVQAQALLARCGERLTRPKRRVLERFVASGRTPVPLAWLALRSLRVLAGRTETLGSETEFVRGILWRWAVDWGARGARRPGRRPTDARYPGALAFEQKRLRRWRARS